ncbi:hypothetical protein HYFRA_00007762 [Hymenoscyphus fraxineus]|uniref:Uncharacterized protein n=1 Tax=Hymenoscyphus fraxineus TaxID=746836 RepID=A0A9N9KP35_9HELO|nr:hypothetical protein HYFRA_00007762 [Hymenoscyphus fraxineus]
MARKSKRKRESMISDEFLKDHEEETKRIKVEEPAPPPPPPPSHNRIVVVLNEEDEVMTDPVEEAVHGAVDQEMHDVGDMADTENKGNTSTGGVGLAVVGTEGSEIKLQRMRTENRRLQEDVIEDIKGMALGR